MSSCSRSDQLARSIALEAPPLAAAGFDPLASAADPGALGLALGDEAARGDDADARGDQAGEREYRS
jgi:hypothetical protein